MRKLIFLFLQLVISAALFAQATVNQNTTLVNGFGKKISGDDFIYHSSIPVARESLLIRATDGKSTMVWETAPVPAKLNTGTVTFSWLAGIGSSPGKASFDLSVNGIKKFTIWADGSDEWSLKSDDGTTLSFKKDLTDQHGDRFGFIYLTMQASSLIPGQPVTLQVTGGNFNKTSWYMTFRFAVENGLTVKALPAISEADGKQYQLGVAGILHFGESAAAKVFMDGKLVNESQVNFGYNYVKLRLPVVKTRKIVNYRLEIADQVWKGKLELNPVRKWRVNFVQHTHTDIGYTRSQTDILAEHLRFIDFALDYCDNTDGYPEESKFRWTCESSWAVDEYLKCRPASQIDRLKQRVKEGRIELTGMYFNFSELPDEQTLAASLQPLKRIRESGMEVKTAMQNDVNGIGWSLNDYYTDLGVRYLNMGTHGHRALICFDKPTLFWWESPSGRRMLAFRAEHYMTGNTVFKIHAGDFNAFEDELLTYLLNLEAKGYEYDLISIQHSGYLVDNSPPSTLACDMIRQWNEKYTWPKLKTASATDFFEEMEEKHGDSFQVIRGAWPDWWTDGFGASAREVATTRQAQSDLIANTAGLTMAALQGAVLPDKIADRIETTNSALLFYTEHTVGYHNSVREPFHKYTMEQRSLKESYAWEASRRARMLGEETMGLLQNFIAREKDPSLVVYNTLNWNRSGLLRVYIDHQILPRYTPFSITDQTGNPVTAQPVEHHSDGTYWEVWVDNIPAFGYKKFVIRTGKSGEVQTLPMEVKEMKSIENQWYKIVIDTEKGAISGITDKELNLELVDQNAAYGIGEFIYELPDNRSQMESWKLDNFTREGLEKVWFDGYEEGEVWNTVKFRGNTRAANRDNTYEFEIRLFNTTKRIDLVYGIEKKLVTDPEGIYIAFPFAPGNGQLAFDVQGGEVRAGIDQIPGSSNDWNTVQNYARLSNDQAQIVLCSSENPLMQFGGINTGRYKAGAKPETTHIYGWPMNNYWTTNFNADQHGGHTWTYTITSKSGNEMQEAIHYGWGYRTPFLSRVLPGGGNGQTAWDGSFITGWPENLLLVSAMPEENGRTAVFHVRETGGKSCIPALQNGQNRELLQCIQVDVTGTPVEGGSLEIKPFESKFFRVEW
ncbi:MAG: glycosyl hydrolase family 38 [Bacteroidales bacterium]|nr:glycosyl hydrolase family 38 [Bacteroidales bacterium]